MRKESSTVQKCKRPVSYTHLDVYKRQTWWLPLTDSFLFQGPLPTDDPAAIGTVGGLLKELEKLNQLAWQADEDTILGDVYKRQLQSSTVSARTSWIRSRMIPLWASWQMSCGSPPSGTSGGIDGRV